MSGMLHHGPGNGGLWDAIDVPHFSTLPDAVRAELRAISTPGKFAAGETVYREGEHIDFVGCVSGGILKMTKVLADGREQIVGLLRPGDTFGRVFGGPLQFTKVAAKDLEIQKFPRPAFRKLMSEHPELENLILYNLLNEVENAHDWMFVMGQQGIMGRLAGFLLVLCKKWVNIGQTIRVENGSLVVRIPINRIDLSNLLGMCPESVSRAVHGLADKGIISIRSTYEFEILDFQALLDLDRSETFAEKESFDELSRKLGWSANARTRRSLLTEDAVTR